MALINEEALSLEATPIGEVLREAATPLFPKSGIGGDSRRRAVYPFPRLYSRATPNQQALRVQELEQAKLDNWFDDTLIPGAVVHGNISSKDVKDNSIWTLRGSDEERELFAKEDNLGVNDADPGEDAIDIFEAVFPYFEKNWRIWATNPHVLNNIARLLSVLLENALDDGDPDQIKIDMVDQILATVPATRTLNLEHWNFYPDDEHRYPKQPFHDEFRDDDVISWLQIATASPYSDLKPYTEHQENFKVTNEMFRQTEPFHTDNLDEAMAEGRVFLVDYKHFNEFNMRPAASESEGGRFFSPIAMFAVPKTGGPLKIIAIQSTQDAAPTGGLERLTWKLLNTGSENRPLSDILTPKSDYWSWQMAKNVFMSMYAMSSVVDHLSTHVFLGAIPVAFYRNIPKQHPLTALLEPHLMALAVNNHLGIFWEIGTSPEAYGKSDHGLLTGLMNKLSGWTGRTFLDATVFEAGRYDFIKNSTPLDRSKPNEFQTIEDFPLHDDEGVFPILERWARNYLSLYYRSDADVKNDHELQAFCYETAHEAKVKSFPESVNSIDEMVDMVTRLMFWMTSNHGLEATLSDLRLAPLGYWSSRTPRNDETMLEANWLNILPPINIGMSIFCGSRIFVDLPREWHRSLGKYPQGQFMHDQRVYKHLKVFQQEIVELDDAIQEKNHRDRRWTYNLKRPGTMTCSPWN